MADRLWIQSWLFPALTTSIILVLLFSIFYFICWQRKKIPQFYALEESGLGSKISRNSLSNLALFRRFSVTDKGNENSIFTSKNLPIFSTKAQRKPESALMDSVDVTKSFDNLILQLEENEPPETTRDELRSCASTDSLDTFYSVHTNLRRNSFVSVISDISDLDTMPC